MLYITNLNQSSYIIQTTSQDVEEQNDIDLKIQAFVKYEHGNKHKKKFITKIKHSWSGGINKRTTIKAASRKWDKKRLVDGKITQFHTIGGQGIRFHTKSGDTVIGCYFPLSNFYQTIKEMGGKPTYLSFYFNHPFFEYTQPVILTSNEHPSIPGIQIPYHVNLDSVVTRFPPREIYT